MPDEKEEINYDKCGWGEDDFVVLPPDGQPADPFAEVQQQIDKIDKQLAEADDEDEEEDE